MVNDQFIKVSKYFLVVGGLWPFKITNNVLFAKLYKIYSKFQYIAYTCFILSLVVNLSILLVEHNQPTRMYSSLNVLIIVMETCIKMWLFQIKNIPEMCNHIMKNEESILKSYDRQIRICYQKEVDYCRRINIFEFIATMVSCVSFTLVSLLQLFASEDMSVFKDHPFMHDMWYPFERQAHMPLVISINMLIVIEGLLLNTATQTTFVALMIYASARLKILQIRLKKFDIIAEKEYGGDVLLTVKKLIAEHQISISFVESLNQRTNYVMLLEFVLNSVSLASGTIQLVEVNTASRLLSICSIVILILVQIFILAWSANEIREESLKVAEGIAASNWYEQSEDVKKCLQIMIMRAQKPVGLTAGPFLEMTTKTALMTVKIAYSYTSVMMQNYQE